jgi:hypothetical protein
MTDLQIGLLVIGATAVAGVLVYNRVVERTTRRKAEETFGSTHPDVLMGAAGERREPTLEAPPVATPAPSTPHPVTKPAAPAPDPRIDYVVEVQGASAGALRPEWVALQRRFARRAALSEAGGRKPLGPARQKSSWRMMPLLSFWVLGLPWTFTPCMIFHLAMK